LIGMRALARFADRQHLLLALLCSWLILSSPWVALLRRLPEDAGLLDRSHVALGLVACLLSVTYLAGCVRGGRWKLYFPWLAGQVRSMARDLRGLLRGRIPAAEGGGLFAAIEGLALLALLVTAATGATWFLAQDTASALDWRSWHIVAARSFTALLLLHVITVSLHLVELARG